MHKRIWFAFILLVSFLAFSINPQPAQAQKKAPPIVPTQDSIRKLPASASNPAGPLFNLKAAISPNASSVTLGTPGFLLRPESRFGKVTEAYIEDTTHLNYPYAVATYGDTVWVADTYGERAIHYSNTASYLGQIGKAGFRNFYPDTDLESVFDIQTDSLGNVYLVDMYASHVAVFKSDGTYLRDIGQRWTYGQANNQLNNPYGIAIDNLGRAYVADSGNCRIQVFQSNGDYLATLGETGVCGVESNHFGGALRHLDIYGNLLYVPDASNHRVEIFDISNPAISMPLQATIGVPGVSGSDTTHLDWPTGVAVDASQIYIADMHNQRVQIFNATTRVYVKTLTGTGPGDTYSYPADVETDASGNLYVADNGHARVVQYNSSQTYTRTYGVKDVPYLTDASHFNRPAGVAAGAQGNVYLVEEWGCRLVVLDKNGSPINTFGEGGVCQNDATHLYTPEGVAVNPQSGEVYVADSGNDRILVFSAGGAYLRTKGISGSGNSQFSYPTAVAIGSTGTIYVADRNNNRVEVFDPAFNYVTSLFDNFSSLVDLATDAKGNLYTLDRGTKSVQIYNQALVKIKTIGGIDGSSFQNFGALDNVTALAVDSDGRIYVAASWGNHILVYDASGAFLSACGSWGDQLGQMRQVEGMAVTPQGKLLIADFLHHTVDGLVQGSPHFLTTSLNGFGDPRIQQIPGLTIYNNELYAGVWYRDATIDHADLYYSSTGRNWANVGVDFGAGTATLTPFNGNLYVGTWDGKIWRSANGKTSWEAITEDGFGDSHNGIALLITYSGFLYATTWNNNGTQVWRSSTGDKSSWTQVSSGGFGSPNAGGVTASAVFNNQLYLGTSDWATSSPFLARTSNGTDWEKVGQTSFQNTAEISVSALAVYNNKLYAMTFGNNGSKVWNSSDGATWQASAAFTVPNSIPYDLGSLEVFNGDLYLIAGNSSQGAQVWRTHNGTTWEMLATHGINAPENQRSYFDTASIVFNNNLYFALDNFYNGAMIWELAKEIYVPTLKR
jgi:DNA-binding beta-propeller fold protein YncE